MNAVPTGSDSMVLNSYGFQEHRAIRRVFMAASGSIAVQYAGDPTPRALPVPGGAPLNGNLRLITTSRTTVPSAFAAYVDAAFEPLQDESPLQNGYNVVTEANVDNTGATDCTAAILTAIAATNPGAILFFPPGTYKIASDALTFDSPRHVVGVGNATVFKAGSAGTVMLKVACDEMMIEHVVMDGNALADTGLWVYRSNAGLFADLSVRNCTGVGALWQESDLFVNSIVVTNCLKGHVFLGCSGHVTFCVAISNDLQGVEVVGPNASTPPTTAYPSDLHFCDIITDLDGGVAPYAEGFIARGWEFGSILGGYFEHGDQSDIIRLDEATRHLFLGGMNITGASTVKALHVTDLECCHLEGLAVANPGTAGCVIYCDDADHFGGNSFHSCWGTSRIANIPLPLELSNGTSQTFTVGPEDLQCGASPTKGAWEVGRRVRKATNTGGWVCTVAGSSGGTPAVFVAGL